MDPWPPCNHTRRNVIPLGLNCKQGFCTLHLHAVVPQRGVLLFEQAFSRQGFPAPCPSCTAQAAQGQRAAIPQTFSRRRSYISPMRRVNAVLSSTSSASTLLFFPVILIQLYKGLDRCKKVKNKCISEG